MVAVAGVERAVELDDVRDVEVVLGMLLERLDPDAVPTCDARAMWTKFVSVAQLAMSGATLMARRVEDSASWKREGARSAADHLSKLAGTSTSDAKRMLLTSDRVRHLPKTAEKMRRGELSPGKAEAIADATSAVPAAEDSLLDGAEGKTLSDVREECLKAKASGDRDATHARIHRERRLRQHTDGEGAWVFRGRGTVDARAVFKAAHDPILNELFEAARKEGRREPREAYAFDALVEMARRATGATTGKTKPSKYLGIVRVDHAALQRGSVEVEGVGPRPLVPPTDPRHPEYRGPPRR